MSKEKTIIITGASSGLGLAFLTHYASQSGSKPTNVIGIDVTPLPPSVASHENISFFHLDLTSESALATLAAELKDVPIHTLIHSAGIRGLVPEVVEQRRGDADGVAAAETCEVMDKATMMRTLEVNTWGTFNTIKTFLPNLRMAGGDSTPKVVIMSSRMGSLSANSAGGGYAYRASKAGLNAVVKSFSIDVPEVAFLLLHPGRVETGLVEWKEEGAISKEESLRDCLEIVGRLGVGTEGGIRSGAYVDRFGERIEW
jgi:NAD(P)-dependent dehydrogenase (short-subunit alcohol dehydrogenase family)